ncbi:MAG: ATP-binding protein [Thermodesulfobacteriota bacterium]|nr:ATP-binding protein [Thermodesulfobacteriota bacterium]
MEDVPNGINAAIVGGGRACKALLELLTGGVLRQVKMNILGVADINEEAAGLKYAREMGIFSTNDYKLFYGLNGLDLIIELTGDNEVRKAIMETKPSHVQLMDHISARLFWEIMEGEQKLKIQKELAEIANFLRVVINGIRDQIMVVNRDYRINELNEALVKRIGKPKHELIGKYCYQVLHNVNKPCDMPDHPCPVQETLKTGEPCEVLHTHFEGRKVRYSRVIAYPVLDDQGRVTQVIEMARDITKWKQSGDQMYNVQKLASLGKLASGMAHELNNPVAVILGFSDLLLEKMEPGSKNYEILKTIERQALNCKRIVEYLLSFARYPEKTEYSTNVNIYLERVLSLVEDTLIARKIILEKNLAEDLPKVRGDSGHLQQVFMNLIINAVAAMEGGGVLTISTRRNDHGNRVEILFKDTGHGIKREYRDKIFDHFFTTRKVGEGTGLGLSVSYGIVTKYDGDITFETVAEEEKDQERRGTTFTVSLPVAHTASG